MDEFGEELTFHLLDELARATVRGRIVSDEFLEARCVTRVGPLMELLLLDRSGTLPLSALPDCQILNSLSVALLPTNACRGTYATDDAAAFWFHHNRTQCDYAGSECRVALGRVSPKGATGR